MDWDAEAQTFITAGEKYTETVTAKAKTTVYYPADFGGVKWHDGSPSPAADVIYRIITQFDRAKEASAIYDISFVPDYESFLSLQGHAKVLSANPLVIEDLHRQHLPGC